MAFKTNARKEADEFISTIERLIKSRPDLIYSIDTCVKSPNVISPSTAADKIAVVEVEIYNHVSEDEVFKPRHFMKIGELGADMQTWDNCHGSDYNCFIEITKRFDG